MMRLAQVITLTIALAGVHGPTPATAKAECLDVPLGLTARIQDGMKYVDQWLQGVRAIESPEYQDVWFVTGDVGGPDYHNHVDYASWAVTSLDPDFAEIYRVDEGHADYLSNYPDSEDTVGITVSKLSSGLGDAFSCVRDAAEDAGGMGLDRKTWDERHGATKRTNDGFATKGGPIRFHAEGERVVGIDYALKDHLSLGEAQVLSFDLLPADSVRSEPSAEEMATDNPNVYTSEWLGERLEGKADWGSADDGTFTVSFDLDAVDGLVSSFSVATGRP